MTMTYKLLVFFFGLIFFNFLPFSHVFPQENEEILPSSIPEKLTLVHAAMCEGIKGNSPLNPGIVFSTEIGKVSCFASFDHVPEKMYIYQKWFHRDKPSTKQRLLLKPPRWATFSSIQLREADKGPWRVEITDNEGNILQVLRFSIVD